MTGLFDYRYNGVDLRAPWSFIIASPAQRAKVCNGMGPKGAGWLVPDTFYGLRMTICGDIHDWMYTFGHAEGFTQEQADDAFLTNMNLYIDGLSVPWLKWLRKRRAKKYWFAVRLGGEKHFVTGDSEDSTEPRDGTIFHDSTEAP